MYKTLCVAVLLMTAFALAQDSKPADASSIPSLPLIVARGKLPNQTAPIPTTTMFTPKQDGLYRLTVYGTMTQSDGSSGSFWSFTPVWTDDSGVQTETGLLQGMGNQHGPFETEYGNYLGGTVVPFEAKAGTPITYSVTQTGAPDNTEYSIYFTLERLE